MVNLAMKASIRPHNLIQTTTYDLFIYLFIYYRACHYLFNETEAKKEEKKKNQVTNSQQWRDFGSLFIEVLEL